MLCVLNMSIALTMCIYTHDIKAQKFELALVSREYNPSKSQMIRR